MDDLGNPVLVVASLLSYVWWVCFTVHVEPVEVRLWYMVVGYPVVFACVFCMLVLLEPCYRTS